MLWGYVLANWDLSLGKCKGRRLQLHQRLFSTEYFWLHQQIRHVFQILSTNCSKHPHSNCSPHWRLGLVGPNIIFFHRANHSFGRPCLQELAIAQVHVNSTISSIICKSLSFLQYPCKTVLGLLCMKSNSCIVFGSCSCFLNCFCTSEYVLDPR